MAEQGASTGSCHEVIGEWYKRNNHEEPAPLQPRLGASSLIAASVNDSVERVSDYVAGQIAQLGDWALRLEAKQDEQRDRFENLLHRLMKTQEMTLTDMVRMHFRQQRDWQADEYHHILEAMKQTVPRENTFPEAGTRSQATVATRGGEGPPKRFSSSKTAASNGSARSITAVSAVDLPVPREHTDLAQDQSGGTRQGVESEVDALGVLRTRGDSPAQRAAISARMVPTNAKGLPGRKTLVADILEFVGVPYKTYQQAQRRPQSWLAEKVDGPVFSGMIMGLVIINSGWIGIQTEVSMQNVMKDPPEADPSWFQIVNSCFAACFTLELLVRLAAFRWSFFLSMEWNWNIYDLLVVVCLLLEEAISTLNVSVLRILRLTRLLRVVRIIRLLRFLTGLRQLMATLANSVSTMVWYILTLGFFLFLFAILCMQVVVAYLSPTASEEERLDLLKYYGTIHQTMYSLYLAATGGIAWEELVIPLDTISHWSRLVFSMYICFMAFGLLNVFTGIIVFQTNEVKQRDRDIARHSRELDAQDFEEHLRGFFADWGAVDEDGRVSWYDFQRIMATFDLEEFLNAHDIRVPDALHLFVLLDSEGSGTGDVGIDELVFGCMRMRSHSRNADMQGVLDTMDWVKVKLQENMDHVTSATRMMGEQTRALLVEMMDLRLEIVGQGAEERPPAGRLASDSSSDHGWGAGGLAGDVSP